MISEYSITICEEESPWSDKFTDFNDLGIALEYMKRSPKRNFALIKVKYSDGKIIEKTFSLKELIEAFEKK
jgi:hypothetical protein